MKLLAGVKELQHAADRSIRLDIVMTVSSRNLSYVKETATLAKELQIPLILNFVCSSRQAMVSDRQANDFVPLEQSALTIAQIKQAVTMWCEIAAQYMEREFLTHHIVRMCTIIKFLEEHTWQFPCAAGINDVVIMSDGSISICETKIPLGNIQDYGFNYIGFWKKNRQTRFKKCFCQYDCAIMSSMNKSYAGNKIFFEMLKKGNKNTDFYRNLFAET